MKKLEKVNTMTKEKKQPPAVINTTSTTDLKDDHFNNKQLSLFQAFLGNTPQDLDQASNSIELWDSIPRFSVTYKGMAKLRDKNGYLGIYKAAFQYRGIPLELVIQPALIERKKDGKVYTESFYPGASEELVEEALRKIAAIQNQGFHESQKRTGVVFTLYQLREELKSRGHTRSYAEIVQSLNILSLSIIEISGGDKKNKSFARSAYFPAMSGVTREDLAEDPNARWHVQFHPLVTESLDKLTYRQFNYQKLMAHSTQLARWLHKLLVNKWTNASMMHDFKIHYSTIKRDSAMLEFIARERQAIQSVDYSMNELKEQKILSKILREPVKGNKNKIIDVIYHLYPTAQFIAEVKAANARVRDSKE